MIAILLTFACFVAVIVGCVAVVDPWGRGLLAVGVLGLLVLEAHERAGDG